MDIFIGYASADRRFGKALKQVLSTTEDHVWHNEELTENGASTLETSNAFILVLSAKALLSDELRSQALHYTTIHNFHPDHRLIAVLLDPIPERDLWLFIRHAQVIERAGRSGAGGDSDAALIAQVKRALLSDEQHPASPIVVDAYDITLERPAVTGVALAHDSKNSWRRIAAGAGAALALLILTAVVSAQIVPGGQHHTALRSPHAATSRSGTPGATANPTKPNATLIVQQMTPTPLPTATATSQPTPAGPLAPVPDLNFTNGFAGANGLQLNSSALIADARLRLTTNDAGETSSVFARAPVPVTTFTTTFTFQDTNASANGFTFTLQNATPSALGSSGAGLGYSGIAQSVAVKFNLWNASADS
ncbi:MAG TPA: hypothetical protein VKB76_11445, partial [Ktedonobacterales bacterium]|nr:hypothetical protein [Ktedonobacterales bacterium]